MTQNQIIIPQSLLAKIARVTKANFDETVKSFRRERRAVIRELRVRGVTDSEVAKLLGVSVQYIWRDHPQKKKPKADGPVES